jgi:hypothetical protein
VPAASCQLSLRGVELPEQGRTTSRRKVTEVVRLLSAAAKGQKLPWEQTAAGPLPIVRVSKLCIGS